MQRRGLGSKEFCEDVRRLQQRAKCSDATCEDIVVTFSKYLSFAAPDFRSQDKELKKAAGVSFLRLNGCPKCHKFIYLPEDRRTHCAQVNKDGTVCGHPRYDDSGKPFEV